MNGYQSTQPGEFSVQRLVCVIKEFACREPAKAVAAAFGAGLLINLLPSRTVVGTVTAVGATLMRPVLLSLGITKAMELCYQKAANHLNS